MFKIRFALLTVESIVVLASIIGIIVGCMEYNVLGVPEKIRKQVGAALLAATLVGFFLWAMSPLGPPKEILVIGKPPGMPHDAKRIDDRDRQGIIRGQNQTQHDPAPNEP